MLDHVIVGERLFDEEQTEVVELRELLGVDEGVGGVGVDLEEQVVAEALADGLDVPTGFDLRLDADVPLGDVAFDGVEELGHRVHDADGDAAGDAVARRAEVTAEEFAGEPELGVEDGRLQDRLGHVVAGEGFERAADGRRVHPVLRQGRRRVHVPLLHGGGHVHHVEPEPGAGSLVQPGQPRPPGRQDAHPLRSRRPARRRLQRGPDHVEDLDIRRPGQTLDIGVRRVARNGDAARPRARPGRRCVRRSGAELRSSCGRAGGGSRADGTGAAVVARDVTTAAAVRRRGGTGAAVSGGGGAEGRPCTSPSDGRPR